MKTQSLFRSGRLTLLLALVIWALFTRAGVPTRGEDPVGIQFFQGSWKAVLAEAKKQNKPVFVDIYTTWCGPCKLMARQAFPDPKVGEKFNANFISYQIDAEKGEGIDLARTYAVTAYPTSLYVSGDGDLIHRAVGYMGIKAMLNEADKAIVAAKDPKPITSWEKEYSDGKRDSTFLLGYLTRRASIGMPNSKALEDYLAMIPVSAWTTDKNVEAISGNLTTTTIEAYQVLYDHIMRIRDTNKTRYQRMMKNLQSASRADYKRAVASRDASQLERLVANERRDIAAMVATALTPDQLEEFVGVDFRMQFFKDIKEWSTYRQMATTQAARLMLLPVDSIRAKDEAAYKNAQMITLNMPDSSKSKAVFMEYAADMQHDEAQKIATALNSMAWTYFENMTNPIDLKQALAWSTRTVELDRTAAFLDTHAQLLGRLGRKAEAAIIEREAITKARAAGEDVGVYERTLAALQKK